MSEETTQDLDEIVALLQICLRNKFGNKIVLENVEQATLGGSNRTLLFDLINGTNIRRLVSRQETYTLDNSPFLAPEIQFELLEVAYANELPVPEPIVEFTPQDGLGRGHVIGFVDGETLPKRILTRPEFSEARQKFPTQAGNFLAKLHAIDPTAGRVLVDISDSKDPIAAQLERYEYYGQAHPAIEFAFRWLEKNRPPNVERKILHGDFRIGNMLIDDNGIKAVLDWECAHLGDPMEDLGWLCTPAWRFGHLDKPVGGIGERQELFEAYEAAGGQQVNLAAVRWWEIFGSLRWALLNIMQVHGHLHGGRRSPAFAACGRNTALIEYDLLQAIAGQLD